MMSVSLPLPHSSIYLSHLYPLRSCSPFVPDHVCFQSLLVLSIPCVMHNHESVLVSRIAKLTAQRHSQSFGAVPLALPRPWLVSASPGPSASSTYGCLPIYHTDWRACRTCTFYNNLTNPGVEIFEYNSPSDDPRIDLPMFLVLALCVYKLPYRCTMHLRHCSSAAE